jgi:hypothetical protein
VEQLPTEELSARELFEYQRRLAGSPYLIDRLGTLWVGAQLAERLDLCPDHEIGDLLSLVQDGLWLFSPDYAVCEHARRRFLRSRAGIPKGNWRLIRDAGIELLNAESALFWSSIPHMLLPFQRDRFSSNVFLVPQVIEARACLLRSGFRSSPSAGTVLVDGRTDRPIRLIEAREEK